MTTTPTEGFTFGVKVADDTDTSSESSGTYIRRIRKPGSYTLRFLEELPAWTAYWEHFSPEKKTTYPCTANTVAEKKNCPGCTSDSPKESKPSKRFLVNAVEITGDKQGYSNLWKLPAPSLKPALDRNFEKYKTITDRDYTVIRTDNSSGTSYELEREEAQPMDLSVFTLASHNDALFQEYQEAWDPTARAAKDERIAAAQNKTKDTKPEAKPEPKVEEQAEEVPDALLSSEERAAKAAKPKMTLAKDPEPVPEPEEEVEITPTSIRAMKADGLVALFGQAGLDIPENVDQTDQAALAESLIKALSE